MKYRSDFVTNSSSSSYIISYQQTPNYDEETLKKYPALACFNRLIEMVLTASGDYSDTDEGKKITTKDELDKHFMEYYVWKDTTLEEFLRDDKYLEDMYNKSLAAIERGCVVLIKNIDYSDNVLSELINELGKGNVGIEIIDHF